MKNVDLFNEFVLRIFEQLYEEFPLQTNLNPSKFIEEVEFSPYPERPVKTDCTPEFFWLGNDSSEPFGIQRNWDITATVVEVEAILKRKLTDFELHKLKTTGHRPVTEAEQQLLDNWEAEVARIESIRLGERELLERANFKKRVFVSTLQFLVNEGLIRFKDIPPPPKAGQIVYPPDILIEKSAGKLSFVLTSKGFAHLNKTLKSGQLADNMTLYDAIKKALKDNAMQGVVASLAQVAITSFTTN